MDTAYSDFTKKLKAVIDEIAPFKNMCVKNSTSEWVDDEIFEAIRNRDKLFKKFKNSRLHADGVNFRRARNRLQTIIKNKKRNFICNKLTENIAKPKELWKTLSQLGLESKKKATSKICLKENGDIKFEPKSNCEVFKIFFETLSTNLVNKLPTPTNIFGPDSVRAYYSDLNIDNQEFRLQPTNHEAILKLIEGINPAKSAGIDKIGGRFLKDGAQVFAKPITELCNLSIRLSKFPDKCKIALLKPLFKKGSKLEAKNYRPISLLPLVSKIFEKVIHSQTQTYLDKNDILYKFQSGFRQNHSTDTALSYLTNKIQSAFDKGFYAGMILIDLQKAFDTIDHEIFLKKLDCLGFGAETIAWYRSYLEDRYFVVNIDNCFSGKARLVCGVPQGSILGPLIFLIYANDMAQSVNCNLYLYADDSCLLCIDKDIKVIENTLNKDFNSLCNWFVENKLSIHFGEDKTKSILFGTKRRLNADDKLEISRRQIKIKQHTEVKYLGCLLDSNLSGRGMAIKVLNKVNSRLRFLYRKKDLLNTSLRRTLCNALIQPHFDYASQTWLPNITKALANKIQCAQNKCIRFSLLLENRSHLDKNKFQEINWLPIDERMRQRICIFGYNFFNNTSPSYMSDIFIQNDVKKHTRNSQYSFKVPLRKTNIGQKTLLYMGPLSWNSLGTDIKLAKSRNIFKHKIKSDYFKTP